MSALAVAEHALDPEPLAARAARRAVVELVGDVLGADELDGLLLATSELVTNAVEHGAPPIELVVERGPDRVRIIVKDGSPMRPRRGSPTVTDVRGRGMTIVERLANRWGVEELTAGKAVWVEVDLTERL